MGKIIRGLGALGGGTLGNLFGYADEGKHYGRELGAAISKWLGTGDYTVKVNSLVGKASSTIPMMHNTGQSIVVRHKEFLCDVVSGSGTPTSFNVGDRFYLNPGLTNSFPWLSTIASQFQEYTWRGIVFHYVPTSGNSVASTNTALGTVMLHTDYRVTAPMPVSKVELLNEYFACDARPSESFCHPIECDPKENPYNVQYVRTGDVPAGEDPKSYDLGVVNVATQGFPGAATTAGELWVTYEVELRKPQISVGGPTASTVYKATSNINTTTPLGTNAVSSINELGIIISTSNGKITFPRGLTGKYMILVNYYSSGSGQFSFASETLVNCTSVTPTGQLSYPQVTPLTTAPTTGTGSFVLEKVISIADPSFESSYTLSMTTITNPAQVMVIVMRLSPAFV
jgi:hypothetical protein